MDISFSFIVATNDKAVLENNFLKSPALYRIEKNEILLKEGFMSAAKAYNCGIDEAMGNVLIFVHQDVFLPEEWAHGFISGLEYLRNYDPNWGVLGVYGVTQDNLHWGDVYSVGLGRRLGCFFETPKEIQTLDEIVLIIRKESGLRFDENLPHFHMYGAEICLAASTAGLKNYAIHAFCIHNSNPVLFFPKEFYESYRFIKEKYRCYLPIQTPCIRISRWDYEYYKEKASGFWKSKFCSADKNRRIEKVETLIKMMES